MLRYLSEGINSITRFSSQFPACVTADQSGGAELDQGVRISGKDAHGIFRMALKVGAFIRERL